MDFLYLIIFSITTAIFIIILQEIPVWYNKLFKKKWKVKGYFPYVVFSYILIILFGLGVPFNIACGILAFKEHEPLAGLMFFAGSIFYIIMIILLYKNKNRGDGKYWFWRGR